MSVDTDALVDPVGEFTPSMFGASSPTAPAFLDRLQGYLDEAVPVVTLPTTDANYDAAIIEYAYYLGWDAYYRSRVTSPTAAGTPSDGSRTYSDMQIARAREIRDGHLAAFQALNVPAIDVAPPPQPPISSRADTRFGW